MNFTREQVIEMAKAAGVLEPVELLPSNQWRDDTIRELTRLCTLAADRALEAAAHASEAQIERWVDDRARYAASECAAAIEQLRS